MKIFHFKKITLICNNEQEWNDAQYELFKLGYEWESSGKFPTYCQYQYPRVLTNYRTDDRFGSKYLIMIDYVSIRKWNKLDRLKNIQNLKSFIRKRKLKKINLHV